LRGWGLNPSPVPFPIAHCLRPGSLDLSEGLRNLTPAVVNISMNARWVPLIVEVPAPTDEEVDGKRNRPSPNISTSMSNNYWGPLFWRPPNPESPAKIFLPVTALFLRHAPVLHRAVAYAIREADFGTDPEHSYRCQRFLSRRRASCEMLRVRTENDACHREERAALR
jgi:hypothetical protein